MFYFATATGCGLVIQHFDVYDVTDSERSSAKIDATPHDFRVRYGPDTIIALMFSFVAKNTCIVRDEVEKKAKSCV